MEAEDTLLNRAIAKIVLVAAVRQIDRGRPAYGRFREDRARQGIFIGTPNEGTYLRDRTGNQRFWSVKTGKISLVDLEKAKYRDGNKTIRGYSRKPTEVDIAANKTNEF